MTEEKEQEVELENEKTVDTVTIEGTKYDITVGDVVEKEDLALDKWGDLECNRGTGLDILSEMGLFTPVKNITEEEQKKFNETH